MDRQPDDRAINDQTDNGNYTNPADPYSKQANDAIISAYVASRKEYLSEVQLLIVAADCGVLFSSDHLAGEQNASLAIHAKAAALMYFGRENVVTSVDTHLSQMTEDAIAQGRMIAARPGACDFWAQHPESVAVVRQEVKEAANAVPLQ